MRVRLAGLLETLASDPTFASARAAAASRRDLQLVGPRGARALLATAASHPNFGDAPLLCITATSREAQDLEAELADLLGRDRVVEFPAWETLPHERLSPTQDVVGRRIAVLRRLAQPGAGEKPPVRVVVAGVRAALAPIVGGIGEVAPFVGHVGDQLSLDAVAARLVAIGYDRVDLVATRGQFAVRGGIIDVFPPTDPNPSRIELFGDEIEEIRRFAVADQRSLPDRVPAVTAPPCRELLLTAEVRRRASDLVGDHPEFADLLEPIAAGAVVEGMESLAPILAESMTRLIDLVPADTVTMTLDPERVSARAADLVATSAEFLAAGWEASAAGAAGPVDLGAASFQGWDDFQEAAVERGLAWWELSPFSAVETTGWTPAPHFRGDGAAINRAVAECMAAGGAVFVSVGGAGTAQRVRERLSEAGIHAVGPAAPGGALPRGSVTVTTSALRSGVVVPAVGLTLLTEADLLGQTVATPTPTSRMPGRRRRAVDALDLTPGDHVVHEQHGVGRFVELTERTVAGATREYLVLEYAPSKRGQPPDRLYVPTDQLDQVTRYVGGEDPSLHRLGGAEWQHKKRAARGAVKQIADELVRLYAARQAAEGRAFSPDTPWQREMEDAFPYVETPDQLETINEVKVDMERHVPMDRLVCGDVGYGKTEIAVRAAFKAVQDGAQVAVLVPTTLLAKQHFQTFSERFAAFPVRVAALSRFQSPAEVRETLSGLADGTVDVVVATHRLLSSDVRFKDLGLIIIDEEQRFGVEHKEHLKALRQNVDVLAMSATPIPRTLEMAVTGIRELSTIQTPPEDRLPVLTYVGRYDDRLVGAAIRRELLRDGQVFFLHNRVRSIDAVADRIKRLVPDARVAVAHGQMSEEQLERVMVDFWERRIDVLACTTIIESGLDITNANTMIVDRADRYGLSQLHQLRGRVGRGSERGYAYFMYDPESAMTEAAHERLATIAQHSELGSGMAVAMKDLEIRGAGNLLGGEQAGHIADVGFDLYVRLVGEALAKATGARDAAPAEVRIELPVDAHIPPSYVAVPQLRLDSYRRIADAATSEEIEAAAAELEDRFGPLPGNVRLLLGIAELRRAARRAGVTEIVLAGSRIRLAPVLLTESAGMRLGRLYPGTVVKRASRTILVPRPKGTKVGAAPVGGEELLKWTRELVETALTGSPAQGKEAS